MVKQTLLEDILSRREILADLKSAYDAAKDDLDRLEDGVVKAVEDGERHEAGRLTAGVSIEAVRRPKWKVVFTEACGADATARVIAATEPSEHKKLVVIARGGKK